MALGGIEDTRRTRETRGSTRLYKTSVTCTTHKTFFFGADLLSSELAMQRSFLKPPLLALQQELQYGNAQRHEPRHKQSYHASNVTVFPSEPLNLDRRVFCVWDLHACRHILDIEIVFDVFSELL